jgi:hypothetical protein
MRRLIYRAITAEEPLGFSTWQKKKDCEEARLRVGSKMLVVNIVMALEVGEDAKPCVMCSALWIR